MNPVYLFAATGIVLFISGLAAAILHPHLLRKVVAVNVAASGVFLLLISLAYRGPETPPDPVPQALVLTGIVISIATTALLLAAVRQLFRGKLHVMLPENAPEDSD